MGIRFEATGHEIEGRAAKPGSRLSEFWGLDQIVTDRKIEEFKRRAERHYIHRGR
jgi:hypothetical protein